MPCIKHFITFTILSQNIGFKYNTVTRIKEYTSYNIYNLFIRVNNNLLQNIKMKYYN